MARKSRPIQCRMFSHRVLIRTHLRRDRSVSSKICITFGLSNPRLSAYPNNLWRLPVIPSASSGHGLRRSRRIWPAQELQHARVRLCNGQMLRRAQHDKRRRVIRIGSKDMPAETWEGHSAASFCRKHTSTNMLSGIYVGILGDIQNFCKNVTNYWNTTFDFHKALK